MGFCKRIHVSHRWTQMDTDQCRSWMYYLCASVFICGSILTDSHVAVRVHLVADQTQGGFEVAAGGLEGVGVDGQRGTEDDQRGAVFGSVDGFFQAQPPYRLHRDLHGGDDLSKLIQRAGLSAASGFD